MATQPIWFFGWELTSGFDLVSHDEATQVDAIKAAVEKAGFSALSD